MSIEDTRRALGTTIVEATRVMGQQRAKGVRKYGVTIEDADLTLEEMIRHTQEEMADGLVYATRAAAMIAARIHRERQNLLIEVMSILTQPNMADDIKLGCIAELAGGTVQPWTRLYAQPSELQGWNSSDKNLMSLNRNYAFPFTYPVLVQL